MARKHLKLIIETGLFILTLALVGGLLLATAWGAWVMIIAWLLDNEVNRLIIIATSVFWASVGVLAWLIRTNRKI